MLQILECSYFFLFTKLFLIGQHSIGIGRSMELKLVVILLLLDVSIFFSFLVGDGPPVASAGARLAALGAAARRRRRRFGRAAAGPGRPRPLPRRREPLVPAARRRPLRRAVRPDAAAAAVALGPRPGHPHGPPAPPGRLQAFQVRLG